MTAVEKREQILLLCETAARLEQSIQVTAVLSDEERVPLLASAQEVSGGLYLIAERFLAPPEVN